MHYGDPDNDEYGDQDLQDEMETRLWKLGLAEGEELGYVYDFGDSWEHTLRVERIRPREKGVWLPLCIGGERACPPEDVGGIGGYAEFCSALAEAEHPEHASYLEWAGGAFDPEAFDLEAANERMRRRVRRKREGVWGRPGESEGTTAPPRHDRSGGDDPSGAGDRSGATAAALSEHEEAARELVLPRDVESFLSYVRDHKVTGTRSTGNLPLKSVAEVAAGFVHPPALERRYGPVAIPIRSEAELWPVYFVHVLAEAAELVIGGPGRRWRLTPVGEQYLAAAAPYQVAVLFAAWWYRVNWVIAVPVHLFGEALPPEVREIVLSRLRELAPGQPAELEPFVDRLVREAGWAWTPSEPDHLRRLISRAVTLMVIEPLEELGVLAVRRARDPEDLFERTKPASFALTPFGRVLLEILR